MKFSEQYKHFNEESEPRFNVTSADEWIAKLKAEIKSPYVAISKGTLGNSNGRDRTSIMMTVSVDPKDKWQNNILQNSRYFQMSITYDGILSMFSGGWRDAKKFRKTNVKDVQEAINKINKYIDEVKDIPQK